MIVAVHCARCPHPYCFAKNNEKKTGHSCFPIVVHALSRVVRFPFFSLPVLQPLAPPRGGGNRDPRRFGQRRVYSDVPFFSFFFSSFLEKKKRVLATRKRPPDMGPDIKKNTSVQSDNKKRTREYCLFSFSTSFPAYTKVQPMALSVLGLFFVAHKVFFS